jgi:cell division protein FtsA
MEEIFTLALRELEKSDVYDSLGAGMVLTGGASLLPGTVELAERVLGLPVKIGTPTVSGGLVETVKSPIYATSVGLIEYALQRRSEDKTVSHKGNIKKIINRLKENLEDLF